MQYSLSVPRIWVVALVWIFFLPCQALPAEDTRFSKENIVVMSNLVGLTAITAWGVLNWDYFDTDPKRADEGWFSQNSPNGGQDKLGHFYFSYTLSHILATLYKNHGYSTRQGAFLGAVSSFGMATWMEFGDSFSRYGFSYEDCILNLMGSMTGYLLYTRPDISEKIDFRVEYQPDFNSGDVFTDYENQKFLMAIKFDGFTQTRKTFLKYLELHLGYYARGYENNHNRTRNVYIGLGFNISRLFKHASFPRVSTVFQYLQLPYTYLELDRDLNR